MSDRLPGQPIGKNLPPIRKFVTSGAGAFLRGDDLDDTNRGAQLVTPYAQSAWVYIAISRLAEKVAQIPFRISRVKGGQARRVRTMRSSGDARYRQACQKALNETIVDSGDVVDLFDCPHPTMDRQLFWEMIVTWLCLRGEFFILPMDGADTAVNLDDRNPNIERLITLAPEYFWHIIDGYNLTAWRYTGSPLLTPIPSEMLLPSEVIHCRTPNPYLYWRGMSPLYVAMVAASSDYAATQYAKGYWLNNADTGVIVTTEQQADPTQQAAILAALRERKRKAGTADRPLFLWGGAKMEKPQLNGMETQFMEDRKMNRQEIAAIFKVPDSVMGFSEAKESALSGGSSALVQEEASFIVNTVGPICKQIEAGLMKVVASFGDDLVGWFDLDSLPVMQEARRVRLDSATKAFALGFTINEINTNYDLGFSKLPWGEKSFLPFNLQEVGTDAPMPGEDDPAKPATDDGKESEDPAKTISKGIKLIMDMAETPATPKVRAPNLKNLWESHIRTRRKSVKMFQSKVGKVLLSFRGKTLAKLDEAHLKKAIAEKRSLVDLIFNQHDFGDTLATELHNPILATLQLAGQELRDEVGSDDPWETPPALAKQVLTDRKQKIMGVGGTVRDQLNTSLNAGLDAGETHEQLSARVRAVFTSLAENESERVARTEVNIVYNTARHESMDAAGIDYKAWLSSHGPNVREAHAAAEEDTIDDPIPIDEPFEVGEDQMMFPGDDSLGAEPGNIINCQCIQIAAEKKEEDEKSITFKIFGFGEMKFKKEAA